MEQKSLTALISAFSRAYHALNNEVTIFNDSLARDLLTDEEFKIMQNHTIIGARILKNMEGYEDEELMMVAYQICRWHHERYD